MIRGKRAGAQVTVYAALSLGLVISLLCTCVQSVKLAVADAEVNMAARLSTEAVFAGYDNKLLKEFGIFAINSEQCSSEKLDYYAGQNAEAAALRNQISYLQASVSNAVYMTENGGYGLEAQVTEYMRSGGFAEIVKDFLDIDSETKKTEKINEVTDKVDVVEDKLIELDETDKKIIRLIRSMDASAALSLTEDICDDCELYMACIEADDLYGANDCEAAYESNKSALISSLQDILDKSREAIELIDRYDETDKQADTILDECRSIISAGSDTLGDISQTIRNDVDDIAVAKTTEREKKVNKKRIRPILESNIQICEQLIAQASGLGSLSYSSAGLVISQASAVGAQIGEINIAGLSSECADVDIDSTGTGTGALSNIRSLIEEGISGIVLAGMEIRQGSVERSGLATEYVSAASGSLTSGSDFNGVAGAVVDTALFNAYIFQKFPSYTDVHGEGSSGEYENWSDLSYVIEYILAGNDDDVSNLNEVILKLSAVREATNFTHIITDTGKRREALALATTLVGVSANAAAVKAAQYVIMGAWSYGESVVDVRRLLKGEELSPIKTNSEWRLSLENMVKMNFDVDGASGRSSSGGAGKFSYEDYMSVLLLMMDQTTKNYRTMQAMELRVIALGQEDFRMRKHIYEAVCSVSFVYDYGGESVERKQRYSYADG